MSEQRVQRLERKVEELEADIKAKPRLSLDRSTRLADISKALEGGNGRSFPIVQFRKSTLAVIGFGSHDLGILCADMESLKISIHRIQDLKLIGKVWNSSQSIIVFPFEDDGQLRVVRFTRLDKTGTELEGDALQFAQPVDVIRFGDEDRFMLCGLSMKPERIVKFEYNECDVYPVEALKVIIIAVFWSNNRSCSAFRVPFRSIMLRLRLAPD